jgi:hypothetical protein
MPRKRKLISKEEKRKIIEKPSLSQEEINTLEQMLEKDEEKADLPELKDFLNEIKTEKFSPSLSKINAPQRIPTRLEGNFADNQTPNNNFGGDDEDPFKYNAGERKPEGAKYIKYEGAIMGNIIPRGQIENIGKGDIFERKGIRLESPSQSESSEKNNFEKYSPANKIDKEKIIKEKPFERREIKYTPEKY